MNKRFYGSDSRTSKNDCGHSASCSIKTLVLVIIQVKKNIPQRESWWDIGIGGKGGVKRKGTRFWEKINDTKILYLALHLVLLHVSAKYRIFSIIYLFPKPCTLPFYTTLASNSYIPPTFSLENVFLYLFPQIFHYHF